MVDVVFDIGRVLVALQPERLLALLREHGASVQTLEEVTGRIDLAAHAAGRERGRGGDRPAVWGSVAERFCCDSPFWGQSEHGRDVVGCGAQCRCNCIHLQGGQMADVLGWLSFGASADVWISGLG